MVKVKQSTEIGMRSDTSAEAKQETLVAIRELLVRLVGTHECRTRELVCTPCAGRYTEVAAWVLAVNGSPPRGMFFVDARPYLGGHIVHFSLDGHMQKMRTKQSKVVSDFLQTWFGSAIGGCGGMPKDGQPARFVIQGDLS